MALINCSHCSCCRLSCCFEESHKHLVWLPMHHALCCGLKNITSSLFYPFPLCCCHRFKLTLLKLFVVLNWVIDSWHLRDNIFYFVLTLLFERPCVCIRLHQTYNTLSVHRMSAWKYIEFVWEYRLITQRACLSWVNCCLVFTSTLLRLLELVNMFILVLYGLFKRVNELDSFCNTSCQ